MKLLGLAGTFVVCLVAVSGAQDAVATLPDSYRLQFENEWVRIVRVHYEPYAKLPAHTHTQYASAYVYLNDSGPVVFKHIGTDYGASTRPATKTGAFRLYRGLEELHEVENTSALPSDFLRVEFKTDPKEPRTLRGRFFREPHDGKANIATVQFENVQVRITRIVVAPGLGTSVQTSASEPALLIALSPAQLALTGGRDTGGTLALAMGQQLWMAEGQQADWKNAGATAAEWLRFDFKTRPLP